MAAPPPVEQTATVGQHNHGIPNAERKSINRFASQALFKKLVIGSESAATPMTCSRLYSRGVTVEPF